MILGSPIKAMPTESFLFCPPERSLATVSLFSSKLTSTMMSMAAFSIFSSSIPCKSQHENHSFLKKNFHSIIPWFLQRIANVPSLSAHQKEHHVAGKFPSSCEFLPFGWNPLCRTWNRTDKSNFHPNPLLQTFPVSSVCCISSSSLRHFPNTFSM